MSGLFGPPISDIWGKSTRRRKRREAANEELESEEEKQEKGGGRKRSRGTAKKLPADVAALLGEAHTELIGGVEERAISLLGEVVRRQPDHPDAYATLSEIYENRGGPEDDAKALQLALVAAHLAPSEATAWRRVAMLSMESARRDRDHRGAAPGDDAAAAARATDDQGGGGRRGIKAPGSPRGGSGVFSEDERIAFDALGRVLKLDGRDAAAAADRAALYASHQLLGPATDELEKFLRKSDKESGGERTTDEIGLELVLAEHAAMAGRLDVAKRALKRALRDSAAPGLGPEDPRREETRARASIDLARLLYEAGDFPGAAAALGDRRLDEPLDVAVVRGACAAGAGNG